MQSATVDKQEMPQLSNYRSNADHLTLNQIKCHLASNKCKETNPHRVVNLNRSHKQSS